MVEFYIVSCEMFRVYKRFSISNRCNKPFKTQEEARNYMHSIVDIMDLKNIYDAVYVETVHENEVIIYVDDGIDTHVMYMIITINTCYTRDKKYFVYRQHFIEQQKEGWVVGLQDVGPVSLTESLDSALDFVDHVLVTRNNVIRITGSFMINTPTANGKFVS